MIEKLRANQRSHLPPGRSFTSLLIRTDVQVFLLGIITLVAGVLRYFRLGTWSFWIDEVFTLDRARIVFDNPSWRPLSEYLIGIMIRAGGVDEWVVRLIPMLVGVLSVPLLYLMVRPLFGRGVALGASLLLALSPWHLFWSQNGRFYTILLLLYTAALIFYFRGLEENRRTWVGLAVVLLTFAIKERLLALFFYPIVVTYLLALWLFRFKRPAGLNRVNLGLLALPLLILGIEETFLFFTGTPVVETQVFTIAPHSSVQSFFVLFFGNPLGNPVWIVGNIINEIGMPVIGLGLAAGLVLLLEKDRAGLWFFAGAIVPIAALGILSFMAYTEHRYVFVVLTSWVVLAAAGLQKIFGLIQANRLSGKIQAIIFAGLLIAVAGPYLITDGLYFEYRNGGRPDWKGAYEVIEREYAGGDVVYASWEALGRYYFNHEVISLATVDVDGLKNSSSRVWVIDSGWLTPEMQQFLDEEARLRAVRDVPTPLKTLRMRVYLYEPGAP